MTQTRLKQLREDAVLTVHELAKTSGVSDDTISKIENGQRVARPSTLRKLARALDVSPQELRRPAKAETLAGAGKAEAPTSGPSQGIMATGHGFEEGWNLEASYWIECLNTQADLCEGIIARGDYGLETMWHLEGAALELWGAYSKTVRRLAREWAEPGQVDSLQRAEARMKAARTATRRAYGERRDAEEDRQKVVDLEARRQLREARYTDQGYANAGT